MEIEIEEYKGQTIKYDDDADKFFCDITIEDKYKTSKRGSLKDLRREIDLFIKANMDFKPFKAILKSQYGGSSFEEVTVKAIRTDKKFIVSVGSRDQQFSKKDCEQLMKYDFDLLKEKEVAEAASKEADRVYYEKIKELSGKLVPIDLSKYDLS